MGPDSDTVSLYEKELLQKAELLAFALAGLKSADAARAAQVLGHITERLERALQPDGQNPSKDTNVANARPYLLPSTRDDFEDFITGLLTDSPKGMSVQEIFDHMDEAALGMKRPTLVVRLHRMARAGKLTAFAHGQYTLSEAQRGR